MKLRLFAAIALTAATTGAIHTAGATADNETLGDKLKKLFVRSTPTPTPAKHRKKSTASRSPSPAPTGSAAEEATSTASPTATPSETPSVTPMPTVPIEAQRTEPQAAQPQYFEPVRPISPGPHSRRRGSVAPRTIATPPMEERERPMPSEPVVTPSQVEAAPPPPVSTPTKNVAAMSPSPMPPIKEFDSYPPAIRKVIELGFNLTTKNLVYKYNSADPAKGGMDCSGFIYYVLSTSGVKDVPRDAREQYVWIRKAGNFQAVLAQRDDSFELDALKPGDLLFWASNYGVSRDPDITQTMIYLGRDKASNQRLMIGASETSSTKGRPRSGVAVFEFKVGHAAPKPNRESGPVFVGYGNIPGLSE